MTWQYPPYTIIFIFTAVLSSLVGIFTLRRYNVAGHSSFAFLMFGVTAWTFFRALEGMALQMPDKIFWGKLEYIGIATVPVFWFLFANEYASSPKWLTSRNVALLWIIPPITFLLALTNDWHGLIWDHILPGVNSGDNLVYGHGAWFWIHFAYSYCLLFIGTLQLFRNVFRFPQRYRDQLWALLIGAALPWIGNVIYVANLSPIKGLDLTPFAFSISGIVYAVGVFRFQLFELVPFARDALIENMVDGVIVIDPQNQIVDINPAAQQLIGATSAAIGRHLEAVLQNQSDLIERYRDAKQAQAEIVVGATSPRYLDLRISSLYDRSGHFSGRLIVLRDITDRKRAEAKSQALLKTSSDMVFQFRADGTCLSCNSIDAEGWVGSPVAVVGNNIKNTMTAELAELTLQNIQQAIKTAQVQTYHYALFLNEQQHFFEGRMEVCAPDEVIAIVRDTTERIRIEEELRKVNQRAQLQLSQIEDLQTTIREQAIRDPLTGLFNSQYFAEALEREIGNALRLARPVSVVAIDIDQLKLLNETYGHQVSNVLVQELANILREQSRIVDLIYRLDDEFAVIMPGASADVAVRRGDQWRAAFEGKRVVIENALVHATISAGIAVYPFHGDNEKDLVREANQALATAQTEGCNRVVLWKKDTRANLP